MIKIAAFIQARMGSTRLPGKTLMLIQGKPLLWHVVERTSQVKGINEIVVLTSAEEKDNQLAKYCQDQKIACFRGSEQNVFERFYQAAQKYKPQIIVRLTADNPFIDPKLVEKGLLLHQKSHADITSTREMNGQKVIRYVPAGFSFDIINSATLLDLELSMLDPFEQEHVIPYFFNHRKRFSISLVKPEDITKDDIQQSFSIDTQNDLTFANQLMQQLKGRTFGYKDVLRLTSKETKNKRRISNG
ncbi:NTP transferase domain-containing protein [Candidatus Woesearchaeota archaeon]|nr:NTP transferase domain-containing protein [Candidatus Woesearchaeota archaeon]